MAWFVLAQGSNGRNYLAVWSAAVSLRFLYSYSVEHTVRSVQEWCGTGNCFITTTMIIIIIIIIIIQEISVAHDPQLEAIAQCAD